MDEHGEPLLDNFYSTGLLRMAIHDTFKGGFVVVGGSAFPLGPSMAHYGGLLTRGSREQDARLEFAAAAREDLQGHGWNVEAPR